MSEQAKEHMERGIYSQSAVPAELLSHNHPSLFSEQLRKGLADQNLGIPTVLQGWCQEAQLMGQPAGAAGWELSELDLLEGGGANTARLFAPLRGKGRMTLVGVKSRQAGRLGGQAGGKLRIHHQESECNRCHSWESERECEVKAQVGRMNSREEEVDHSSGRHLWWGTHDFFLPRAQAYTLCKEKSCLAAHRRQLEPKEL